MVHAKQAILFNVAEKRATLYLVMVGIWFLILAGSAPGFWRAFNGLDSLLAKDLFPLLAASPYSGSTASTIWYSCFSLTWADRT